MPEKPWSCIHVDHAINFMGNNWLIVTDAYSKYPCIHQTRSTSTQATTTLLEEDLISSFRIPSYNCVRQRNNLQFCRVPAMVPPEKHKTPDWRSLPSSHQWSCREDGAVFQAVIEEVQAAYQDRCFAAISSTHRPGTSSPWSYQEPTEGTDSSSARPYSIRRRHSLLRSVLWSPSNQYTKMGSSYNHQSPWHENIHRQGASQMTTMETTFGATSTSLRSCRGYRPRCRHQWTIHISWQNSRPSEGWDPVTTYWSENIRP